MRLVRGSEVSDFLRCRLRWQYAWVDGYRSKQLNDKLFIGNLVHRFLEIYHSPDFYYDDARQFMHDMFKESSDMSQESVDAYNLAVRVTTSYANHYEDNFEVIATELKFAIPLQNDIVYTGTIDLVYKVDGKLYFMDHKTTASIDKYEKNAIMDRQISRYWWALQQLGKGIGYIVVGDEDTWIPVKNTGYRMALSVGIAGFIYNIILKDSPVPPKVLQSEKLSKDKAQKTTYGLYLNELIERGLAVWSEPNHDHYIQEEYHDILDHLRNTPKEFFRRTEVIRSQAEIDDSMREFFRTANDMEYVRPRMSELAYRNITNDCHWDCSFKDVCMAGMNGSDVSYLLNMAFAKEELNNGFDVISN